MRKFELNFIAVDGKCHSELADSLSIRSDEYPVFFILNIHKNSIYVHKEKFIYEHLTKFVNSVLRDKVNGTSISSPEFQDKVCESDGKDDAKGRKNKKKLNKSKSEEL